jgi:hypothetical protein
MSGLHMYLMNRGQESHEFQSRIIKQNWTEKKLLAIGNMSRGKEIKIVEIAAKDIALSKFKQQLRQSDPR